MMDGMMTTAQKTNILSRPAIRIAAIVLLVALIAGGAFGVYSRVASQNRTSTANSDTLQTAKATLGDLVMSANGTGKLMPAEESSFGFNTSGQVSEILVKIGDHVEAGQVLAQLDDTTAKVQLAETQEAMDKLTSVRGDCHSETNAGRCPNKRSSDEGSSRILDQP